MVFLFIGRFIDQKLVQPLAIMGKAAHEIAAGNLDVKLPESGVREVVEVAAAFKVMRDSLQASVTQQARLEQERRLFISAVAHDLRTPLFALRGYLQGLATGVAATPERAAQYLAASETQAAALDARVSDLFVYARIEYLGQPLQQEQFVWGRVVEEVIERLQPKAEAKQLHLQVADDTADACVLEGDANLLTRAIENLVDNAIQHTPAAGQVQLKSWASQRQLHFMVSDTGPGLKSTDALFELDGARNTSMQGAGIGLLIAQRLVQAHGGQLTLENKASGGTEIQGWLPMLRATERGAEPKVLEEP
jgi:signal transduction histidine kinase